MFSLALVLYKGGISSFFNKKFLHNQVKSLCTLISRQMPQHSRANNPDPKRRTTHNLLVITLFMDQMSHVFQKILRISGTMQVHSCNNCVYGSYIHCSQYWCSPSSCFALMVVFLNYLHEMVVLLVVHLNS